MGYQDPCILEEVPSPWGRPDLVALRPNPSVPTPFLPTERAALSLISLLESKGSSRVCDLSRRLGISMRGLERLLGHLEERGLIENRKDLVLPSPAVCPGLGHLIAVELKVADWGSGLAQACRYRIFADEVLLFLGRASRRVNLDGFRRARVGLVDIGRGSVVLVPTRPTTSCNVQAGRRLVEARVGRLLGSF